RDDMYNPALKDSEYGGSLLPPDFLRHEIKAGSSYPDLYRTIASGIGGTPMPPWKNSLPEDQVWALVYYVRSLIELNDTREARALRDRRAAQRGWHEPPPSPPPPPPSPSPPSPNPAPSPAPPSPPK